MTIHQHSSCIGVVLAGGRSTRMGKDKALLNRNEQNMLEFSQQQLTNAGVDKVIISGSENGLADSMQHAGPLGGIYTVIEKIKPAALLVLPVDLPMITSEALAKLKTIGELSQQACFYHQHYLPLYLPVTAFTEQFFQQKFSHAQFKANHKSAPSIRALLSELPHKVIPLEDQQALFNANTPEDWLQAQTLFAHSRTKHGQI